VITITRIAAIAAIAICPLRGSAQPAEYEIDPEHVTVAFLVAHLGYAKVLGQFLEIGGSYRFDETTGEVSNVNVVAATRSVSTNHDERDGHLRSKDFLNVSEFPEMRFVAPAAQRTGERTYDVRGQLTLLGKTQPLTLRAVWNKSGEYPFGGAPYVMGVSLRGSLRRSQFGMTYGVDNGWVDDEVEIIIEFEARKS